MRLSGHTVIPLKYDSAGDFCEGLARVGVEDEAGNLKYGYIDTHGNPVTPLHTTRRSISRTVWPVSVFTSGTPTMTDQTTTIAETMRDISSA